MWFCSTLYLFSIKISLTVGRCIIELIFRWNASEKRLKLFEKYWPYGRKRLRLGTYKSSFVILANIVPVKDAASTTAAVLIGFKFVFEVYFLPSCIIQKTITNYRRCNYFLSVCPFPSSPYTFVSSVIRLGDFWNFLRQMFTQK